MSDTTKEFSLPEPVELTDADMGTTQKHAAMQPVELSDAELDQVCGGAGPNPDPSLRQVIVTHQRESIRHR